VPIGWCIGRSNVRSDAHRVDEPDRRENWRPTTQEQAFWSDRVAYYSQPVPVGLDIGAEGPEEIALAIVAELVAIRSGRAGGRLAGWAGPIHAKGR